MSWFDWFVLSFRCNNFKRYSFLYIGCVCGASFVWTPLRVLPVLNMQLCKYMYYLQCIVLQPFDAWMVIFVGHFVWNDELLHVYTCTNFICPNLIRLPLEMFQIYTNLLMSGFCHHFSKKWPGARSAQWNFLNQCSSLTLRRPSGASEAR